MEERAGNKPIKNGAEYMFGQIMARLNARDETMKEIAESMKELDDKIDKLPCPAMTEQVGQLQKWKKETQEEKKQKMNQAIQFKHAVWLIIITVLVSSVVGAGTALFSGGG